MVNHTTISTARYRVELAPHLDDWMRGDRFGTVVREYHTRKGERACQVLMDKSHRLRRYLSDDLTPVEG